MASKGVIFKRCQCPDPHGRRARNRTCERLAERRHGSWHFDCRVDDLWGRSIQIRKGGFASRAAATRARDHIRAQSREERAGHSWTVQRWLQYWLKSRLSIRPTTARVYAQHINSYLIPYLGQVRLSDLTSRQLTAMFADLQTRTTRHGRPLSPATLQRIRATLRTALNAAIREGMITDNVARRVELPNGLRPQPVVWTPPRVTTWQQTGEHEPVSVWTPRQLATFLDRVAIDRLYALWWLIALRGLRRGEAAGLRWRDVDLQHRQISIVSQRTNCGGKIIEGPPKSKASRRVVALDRHTTEILREHLRRQQAEARAAGTRWHDSGYVFTLANGRPLDPAYITRRFARLRDSTDLPPVRLHDLRHGAASLAHEAGVNLKTVQDQLGHASIVLTADTYTSVLTADTYTSVLPRAQHRAAAATAELVLSAARHIRHNINNRRNHAGAEPQTHTAQNRQDAPNSEELAGPGAGPAPRRPRSKRTNRKHRTSNHSPHRTRRRGKTARK
jgi:integrase